MNVGHAVNRNYRIVQRSKNFFSIEKRVLGFLWWRPILYPFSDTTLHSNTLEGAEKELSWWIETHD